MVSKHPCLFSPPSPSSIMGHNGAIFEITWPVFKLKQDLDSNNVSIKFQKNQWRNVGSIMFTSDHGD